MDLTNIHEAEFVMDQLSGVIRACDREGIDVGLLSYYCLHLGAFCVSRILKDEEEIRERIQEGTREGFLAGLRAKGVANG